MPKEPQSLTFDDLAFDPYPWFDRLRTMGGAVWAPNLSMWLVTGYQEVVAVLRDPERFTNDSSSSLIQSTFGRQMLSVEGEEQKRYKQACLAPFTGKAARDVWQPEVTVLCQQLLDAIEPAAGATDLMASYAAPIALETMGIVIGLPSRDLAEIRSWYEVFARSLANFEGDPELHEDGQQAAKRMRGYLADQLERRGAPAGVSSSAGPITLIDVLSESSVPLDREEILANLLIVLFGGIETTESMIGNALWYLLTEAGALRSMFEASVEGRSQAGLVPDADRIEALIEESLRFEPAVQTLTRHATREVELFGETVRAGDTVQCMVGGANRDPAVFADPHRFDPRRYAARDTAKHLAFGLGSHFCLGAQLARAETRTALRVLLERFPGLTIDRETSLPPHGHEFRKPGRVAVHLV